MNHPSTTHAVSFALERRVCKWLMALIAALVVLYTLLLAFSIQSVVQREEFVRGADRISEQTAALEKKYLAYAGTLTEERAQSFGLVAAAPKIFVERQSLSFRDDN